MAASVMMKVLLPFFLTTRTRVSKAPAWATRKRTGFEEEERGLGGETFAESGSVAGDLVGGVEGGVGVVDAEARLRRRWCGCRGRHGGGRRRVRSRGRVRRRRDRPCGSVSRCGR